MALMDKYKSKVSKITGAAIDQINKSNKTEALALVDELIKMKDSLTEVARTADQFQNEGIQQGKKQVSRKIDVNALENRNKILDLAFRQLKAELVARNWLNAKRFKYFP